MTTKLTLTISLFLFYLNTYSQIDTAIIFSEIRELKTDEIPFLHLFRNDRQQMKERGLKEYTFKLYQEYLQKY